MIDYGDIVFSIDPYQDPYQNTPGIELRKRHRPGMLGHRYGNWKITICGDWHEATRTLTLHEMIALRDGLNTAIDDEEARQDGGKAKGVT